jgi:hypothetical protein
VNPRVFEDRPRRARSLPARLEAVYFHIINLKLIYSEMGLPAALVAQEATPLLRKKDAAAAPPSRGWRFVVVGAALIATVLATLLVTARVSSRGVKLGGGYSLLNETAPIYSETGLPAALVAQEATATELQIPREVDEKTPSPALRELIDALTMGPDDDVPPPETVGCSPAELAEARAAVFDDGILDDGDFDDGNLDDGDFDGPREEEHGTKRKRDDDDAVVVDDDVSAEPAASGGDVGAALGNLDDGNLDHGDLDGLDYARAVDDDVSAEPAASGSNVSAALERRARCREAVAAAAVRPSTRLLSHTTPHARRTPFLKEFFSRRRSSPALPFQQLNRLTGETFD